MKERLFRLGVDPGVTSTSNGATLLHAACARGAARVAKLVVRRAVYESHPPRRAFLDARARDGRTARDVALDAGFERVAEWLAALGAASSGAGSRPRTGWDRTRDSRADPYAFFSPAYADVDVGGGGVPLGVPGPRVRAGAVHRGWVPSTSASPPVAPTDAYLLGALESVLGDLEDEDAPRAFQPHDDRDDRARARRLVRRVSELVEDRDDLRADLETCAARAKRAEELVSKLRVSLRSAERARDEAATTARAAVAAQRDEERRAVLDALGLAETRAVRMAAERETLREERDAIAEALAFVKHETRALFSKTDATSRGADDTSGIEPGGGGLHEMAIPTRCAEDAVDETAETLQMLEVPLED